MPDYPPYTYVQDGAYHGFGYEAFVSIMADLQQNFTIVPEPNYGRAVKDLQNQVVDGLFLASENEERNAVAEFSEAVSYSGWTWVWLKERTELDPAAADFKKKAIVSAQLNSNTYLWIVKQNYKMAGAPSNIRMLFTMLNSRRVDAILLPELTAKAVMQQEKLDPNLYSMHLEVQLPFGIYISKAYIARNPDIMPKLNQAIRRYHDRKQNSDSASFD
ncbi:substrate-binding periplasmic protein [Rheinheimera soli]|uniref:substrate-binding periplasmic protein n=1 Tax=Rheinheimera soli TaxID=443616 RepID=UPI001E4DCF7E|nr:transporter substrate-binding domain-containing protein [Rheinheimera soli]